MQGKGMRVYLPVLGLTESEIEELVEKRDYWHELWKANKERRKETRK